MTTTADNPDLYDGRHREARDPEYLRTYAPVLGYYYHHYFRVQAYGGENLPTHGPALLIGNHSGGFVAADAAMTLYFWIQQRGLGVPAYALIDPTVFGIQGVNAHVAKCGGLRAHPRMAKEALENGDVVLLYPGGAADSYRPYSRRNQIELAGNKGFIKLALQYGAPIVPIVTTAHNTLFVLDDGVELAQTLGLGKEGVERLPVTISMLGLSVGTNFELPFPVPFKITVGEPLCFRPEPRAAKDPAIVAEWFAIVQSRMQKLLDGISVGS